MTSKTHDLFAFASLVTLAVYYPPSSLNTTTLAAASIGSVVGSLLPDIDQASNRLWDLLPAGNFLGRIFKKLLLGHRTISHSLLGIYLASEFLHWLLPRIFNANFLNLEIIYWSIMIGFVSHLLLDFFTEEGVPLLFPLKWKFGFPPIRQWRIETGKWFEKWVVFPLIVVYLFWFTINNKSVLLSLIKLVIK